ncbi:Centrosomal protein of 164 kDa, partial [Buceros rhinoceros silvestris]
FAPEIGTDPENEPKLLWLARDALMAPLPHKWKACQDTTTGHLYYYNFATGQSSWDHPRDNHYRGLVIHQREKLLARDTLKKRRKKRRRK